MKLLKKGGAVFAAFLILLLPLLCGAGVRASAEDSWPWLSDFRVDSYGVEMSVSSDRVVSVKEVIAVTFAKGSGVHGIIRDFPLDSGVRYLGLEAACSDPDFSPFTQRDDTSFLSLYLRGAGRTDGKTRTYTLTYRMAVPALEEGYLPLDVIGYGWQCPIGRVSVRVEAEGVEDFRVYSGREGSGSNAAGVTAVREGNAILLTAENLGSPFSTVSGTAPGITLDLKFGAGVLSTAPDPALLIALALGGGLLLLALFLKAACFRAPLVVKAVNLEAPEEMDPLLMGKLIDDTVDSEDYGALIFYLADKGYLKIDLRNEDDPRLVQTYHETEGLSEHAKVCYEGLFRSRDEVRASDLTNRFYSTAEKAKQLVAREAGPVFTPVSRSMIFVLAAVCVLLLGLFPLVYGIMNVFADYYYWFGAVACGISYALAAGGSYVAKRYEFHWKTAKRLLFLLGGCALGLLPCLVYLLFPSAAFGFWTGFLLTVFSAVSGAVAGQLPTRTKQHAEKLGHILGFKQFIQFTEKDRIAFMLKEDPVLYYHVLPYAQVLGVTDAWTDKFEGLDLAPPAYALHYDGMFLDLMIWNSLFRRMSVTMSHSMVSRPSSSGRGFSGGGFGGGFGGGGFGGGGGRSC